MDRVLEIITERSGTVLKDARLSRIKKFIDDLVQSGLSLRQIEAQLRTTTFDDPLWQQILQQITVGETYFFRNAGHFNALRNQLLPALIHQRQQQNRRYLRIWIAGCATGEEAYSIAMLLYDLLPDLKNWSIFLLATDINLAFLEFAKRGIYRGRAFRSETPSELQTRFFTETESGFQVIPAIRKMVTFAPLNLMESTYPALGNNTTSLDLISCRNVTIYFDRPTTQSIVNRFYEALRPEGWLLVGHSEPQSGVYDALTMKNLKGAIIYQKPLQAHDLRERIEEKPQIEVAPAVMPNLAPSVLPIAAVAPVEADQDISETVDDLLAITRQAADDEDWETALGALEAIESIDRFQPLLHYFRGLVFTHLNEMDNAVKAFRQAVYCLPDFPMAHYALGELLLTQGNMKAAFGSWQRARKALGAMSEESIVMGAEDLTASMLCELLDYRLQQQEGYNHV